jgi:NAD(P)H-flavin reductase
VLRNARDATKLTLLFAASTPDDVLLMHEIVGLAMRHQAQFTLVLTVSTPTPAWHDSAQRAGPVAHESGRLTAEMVARHAPRCLGQRPFPDWCVAGYCGPPSFEACAKQILATLGYGENGLRVYRW